MAGTPDRVGLGFVGVGIWAGRLADAVDEVEGAEIVACHARTEESRQEFAFRHSCRPSGSLEELLADDEVDGVVIATPHSTHADLVCAAAAAGKHIYVDKPLTVDYGEARRAVEAAEAAGVILQVGHHRRRQPGVRRLKELVDDGELGMVHLLEANYSRPSAFQPRPGWRRDPAEAPLGGMTGYGVHMLDNFNFLVGGAKRVSAYSKRLIGLSARDDVTVLAIEFESGPLGQLSTSSVIPETCVLGVYGTEGSAWTEENGRRFYRQGIDDGTRREEAVAESADSSVAEQMRDYAECISTGAEPEVGGRQGLEVVAVLEAAILSVERGTSVDIAELV